MGEVPLYCSVFQACTKWSVVQPRTMWVPSLFSHAQKWIVTHKVEKSDLCVAIAHKVEPKPVNHFAWSTFGARNLKSFALIL